MKIVSAAEMQEIDRATSSQFGVPSLSLMEKAGRAVAECIPLMAQRVLVVCGKGNNGGDGLVAARHAHESGKDVTVLLLAEPSQVKGDAQKMLMRSPVVPQVVTTTEQLEAFFRGDSRFDVVVDAIFGTGFKPPAEGIYAAAIAQINALHIPTISVDLPSGADADATGPIDAGAPVVHAHEIVTFTALKPAHVFAFANVPTSVRQIGTPDEAVRSAANLHLVSREDIAKLFKPRIADSNKGSYGHVLVVGGSVGKAGAPAMTGMSALRIGAGLATVAVPRSILPTVAGFMPELMTEPLPESDAGTISGLALERVRAIAAGKTALAIGPGGSMHPDTATFIRTLVAETQVPVILDADGLNAFAGHVSQLNGKRRALVLTPHPGEMARLNGMAVPQIQADRIATTRRFAEQCHAYVVLKGHRTVIAEPDGKVWINTTGNAGMATGGTGDILTGMIAGLVAQFPADLPTSVIAAVHLHGMAGNLAVQELGEMPLVATDLLRFLPQAIRQVQAA